MVLNNQVLVCADSKNYSIVMHIDGWVINGFILSIICNPPLPRVCLSWQTAQTPDETPRLQRLTGGFAASHLGDLRRHIWVCAVCRYYLIVTFCETALPRFPQVCIVVSFDPEVQKAWYMLILSQICHQ